MRQRFLTMVIVAAFLCAFPLSADACPEGKKGHDKKGHCMKCEMKEKECKITKLKKKAKLLWEHQEKLEITSAQLEKIKNIKHAAIKKMIQDKANIDIVKVDLESELYQDRMNLDDVNTLISKKYSAKEEYAKTFVKAVSEIQNVLNDGQRKKWKELIKMHKKKDADCPKCKDGDGKYCPITGKPLGSNEYKKEHKKDYK